MDDVKPTIRQPVPSLESQDEMLSITDKNLNIWAIKVPRVLLDRWEQVKEAGVELATMRIEHERVERVQSMKHHADSLALHLQESRSCCQRLDWRPSREIN